MNISAAGLQERKEPLAVDTGERKEGRCVCTGPWRGMKKSI